MHKKSYLFNKKILLGITGSISAYKSITLVRLLIKLGAKVQVILTPSAKDFVSPLVLSVLSKNKVLSDFFSNSKNSIIRIIIPPSESVNLIYQFSNRFKYYLDWGGALIWLEAFELSEEMFESIRRKVVKVGGHVTMIKNSDYLPYVEDVFTINRSRFNLSQNIKKSFDPKRILNPGKMYTGI